MKAYVSALCLAATASLRSAPGERAWTYLPASGDSRPLEALAIPEAPTEKVVTLVGAAPGDAHRRLAPTRIIALDIPGRGVDPGLRQMPFDSAGAVPQGAFWPDSSGRISPSGSLPSDSAGSSGIRNPWEVRAREASAGGDTVYLCGGVVSGGEGGPIAILNGHVVKRGDAVGGFAVARVIAKGVLLEKDGSFFVIPRGMRTTVATIDQ